MERPVLINSMGPMGAALVAARLLRAFVARRGSIVSPSSVETLEKLLERGLSDEIVHHCRAEAVRILEWIDHRPSVDEASVEAGHSEPDLELMMGADLESRLSVARFALDEGFDLELEYFDESTRSWPRVRAAVEDVQGEDAADFNTCLQLIDGSRQWTVPLKYVRWLMPVASRPDDEGEEPKGDPGGDLVFFPGVDHDGLPGDGT